MYLIAVYVLCYWWIKWATVEIVNEAWPEYWLEYYSWQSLNIPTVGSFYEGDNDAKMEFAGEIWKNEDGMKLLTSLTNNIISV